MQERFILLCQCHMVVLRSEQRDYIATRFDDCLLTTCMLALRGEFNALQYEERIKQLCSR